MLLNWVKCNLNEEDFFNQIKKSLLSWRILLKVSKINTNYTITKSKIQQHSINHSLIIKQHIFLIIILILISGISINSYSNDVLPNPVKVPKEHYFTYATYLLESPQAAQLVPLNDWKELKFQSPLIAKYQLSPTATLSITRFTGNIGSDLDNINRWHRQLNLGPITNVGTYLKTKSLGPFTVKIVQLSNQSNYMTMIWIPINNHHFFNKIESSQPFNIAQIEPFIINQQWDKL